VTRPARQWIPGERVGGQDPEEDALPPGAPTVGVLALQGDVLEHLRALRRVGANAVRVRRTEDLDEVAGLVVPGGESTTIGRLLDITGMLEPLRQRIAGGLPVFGTCAGLILLSRELAHGRPQPLLGGLDVVTRRNAFGRQIDSFEADIEVAGLDGGPLHAVFIRAPWIEEVGDGVEVLSAVDDRPVLVAQGAVIGAAFHPELTGDLRLHRLFVHRVEAVRRGTRAVR
jgi:pyridoxal 5'-phosphate synthase pdxT subunit